MAKLDATNVLKIRNDQVDGILQAGRKEDASSWLRNWRYERGIPIDSGVMPGVDEVPLYYRPYLFPRAEASPQDNTYIAEGKSPFTTDKLQDQMKIKKWMQNNDKVLYGKDKKLAMEPADVPLGDGMIYDAKTKMQKNLKQKYDLMLQEGFIDEVEYKKQMDRHFGTKGKK